jgi:DNA-directed RNA polymerase subunit RPC12/RpoP
VGIFKQSLKELFGTGGLETRLKKFQHDVEADLAVVILTLVEQANGPIRYKAYFDYFGRALGYSIDGSPTKELYTSRHFATRVSCIASMTEDVGNCSLTFKETSFIFISAGAIQLFDRRRREWQPYPAFDMKCRECGSGFKSDPMIIYKHQQVECPNCSYKTHLRLDQRSDFFLESIV